MSRPLAIAAVVLLTTFTCCSGADRDDASRPEPNGPAKTAMNRMSVEISDYRFSLQGSLTAGDAEVEVQNSGQEAHMVRFGRIRPGKVIDDVRNALVANDDAALGEVFSQRLGAPGGIVSAGGRYRASSSVFDAGSFALFCTFVGAGDGVPHFAKGMLTVMDIAPGNVVLEPKPDATYAFSTGKIDGPTTLAAGEVTLTARAARTGPHQFMLARKTSDATTLDQVHDALTALFEGQRPLSGSVEALPVGDVTGLLDIDPGTAVSVTLSLTPGTYFIGCVRPPDAGTRPTAVREAHQEVLEVTVK